MKALVAALALGLGGVVMSAGPVSGALEIVVAVSPAEGVVGRPIEVLVRTFVPIGEGESDLPIPSFAYPAPSGLWNVLFPVADYPFDVTASTEDGTAIPLTLARDPSDATLWRGTFTPTTSGLWTISVRNFGTASPGASARVPVVPGETVPLAAVIGVVGLAIGLMLGRIVGRRQRG